MQYLLHRLTLVLILPLEHEALASGQPGKSNAVIFDAGREVTLP